MPGHRASSRLAGGSAASCSGPELGKALLGGTGARERWALGEGQRPSREHGWRFRRLALKMLNVGRLARLLPSPSRFTPVARFVFCRTWPSVRVLSDLCS